MSLPPLTTSTVPARARAAGSRYRVIITDYSGGFSVLESAILTHTAIPREDVASVMRERPIVLADAVTREEADRLVQGFDHTGANIQLLPVSTAGVEDILDYFLLCSEANCVFLMDRSGFLISARGDTSRLDIGKITGLIAAVYAATKKMALFLGEEDFSVLFHPGNRASITINLVGERCIVVVQFEKRKTSMRLVRLYGDEAARKLADIL